MHYGPAELNGTGRHSQKSYKKCKNKTVKWFLCFSLLMKGKEILLLLTNKEVIAWSSVKVTCFTLPLIFQNAPLLSVRSVSHSVSVGVIFSSWWRWNSSSLVFIVSQMSAACTSSDRADSSPCFPFSEKSTMLWMLHPMTQWLTAYIRTQHVLRGKYIYQGPHYRNSPSLKSYLISV